MNAYCNCPNCRTENCPAGEPEQPDGGAHCAVATGSASLEWHLAHAEDSSAWSHPTPRILAAEVRRLRAGSAQYVVPFISGISRIRFDVAAHDLAGLRKATLALLDMIDESPGAPGWAYGGMEGNGVANPVTYRKAQHDETGRMLDWPSEDPLPRGYSFVHNIADDARPGGSA